MADDDPTMIESLMADSGASESPQGRSQDDECDECGTSEGSVTVFKEAGVALCRSCKNDPDVLNDHLS